MSTFCHINERLPKRSHRVAHFIALALSDRFVHTISTKMTALYSRAVVLGLYRRMLKDATKFNNYNFREHAKRRIKWDFRVSKDLPTAEAEQKYTWGVNQAEALRRQVTISQLYPQETSVVARRSKTNASV